MKRPPIFQATRVGFAAVTLTALLGATALGASPAMAAEPVGGPLLTGSGVIVDPGPNASALPDVGASTWVLADLNSGAILAAQGPHIQRAPASTLKTLTALTLIPRLDAQQVYTTTYNDVAVEGSRVGLIENGDYTVAELFQGLFLQSGNDAAMALASANGGFDLTLAQMNEEASRLQAFDTLAKTTSGLPAEGQISSAYDLALIARAGLTRPDFLGYANTITVTDYPGYMPTTANGARETFTIANQNPLLNPIDGRAPYEGAIGLKTGWTTEAGKTFIGAAERGDTALVVTLMNFSGPTFDAAAPLLDWGFANIDRVTPVGVLVDPVRPALDAVIDETTNAPDQGGSTPDGAAAADTADIQETTGPLAAATTVGGNAWAWGLLAAMIVGALLVFLGIRSMRPPKPRPRRNYAQRSHDDAAEGSMGPEAPADVRTDFEPAAPQRTD
ncbi:MAG: D-alanyl-D-alanine carboxypeptidase family protein [Actinomycetes bacterium]